MQFVDLSAFKKEPEYKAQTFQIDPRFWQYTGTMMNRLPQQDQEYYDLTQKSLDLWGNLNKDYGATYKGALDFYGKMAPGGLYNFQTNANIDRAGALAKASYADELNRQQAASRARLSGMGYSPFGDSLYSRRAMAVPGAEFAAKTDYQTALQRNANDQNFIWKYDPTRPMGLASNYMQWGTTPLDLVNKRNQAITSNAANIGNVFRLGRDVLYNPHQDKNWADWTEMGINTAGTIAMMAGCWVAREVYGVNDIKWRLFRLWNFNDAPKWFLKLYLRYGERFADYIRNKPIIKSLVRKWMDRRIYGSCYRKTSAA